MKIKRATLHVKIADALREMIMTGEFTEGDKINEAELCDRMEISKTPLREALRVLSVEGLIRLVPNHGAFVTLPTIGEVTEMFDVMAVLEGVCARRAAEKMTDGDFDRIAALHGELEEAYEARDQKAYIRVNDRYHSLVQELAENRTLNGIVNGLRKKILLHRFQSLNLAGRIDDSIGEHRALLAAFRDRNGSRAEELMKVHLKNQAEALRILAEMGGDREASVVLNPNRKYKGGTMRRAKGMRTICLGLALAVGLALAAGPAHARSMTLKVSHQFAAGDVRDQMARVFGEKVTEKTNGEIKFRYYPASSLYKAKEQWDALRKGALDLSVFPLDYASGKVPQLSITLMPCSVSSIPQGLTWRNKPIGKKIDGLLEENGVKNLIWAWFDGGIGSKIRQIKVPADVEGTKMRAAGKKFEYMMKEAGASITSMPSSETYHALSTGVLNTMMTSSASFVSYRLYEVLDYINAPRDYSIWYMAENLIMGKKTWDRLSPEQQKAFEEVAEWMHENWVYPNFKTLVDKLIASYTEAGVAIHYMTKEEFNQWLEFAKKTAWKEYADTVEGGQELLDLALDAME